MLDIDLHNIFRRKFLFICIVKIQENFPHSLDIDLHNIFTLFHT